MKSAPEQEALQWQVGIWDRIFQLYLHEIDPRFAPVAGGVTGRAAAARELRRVLRPGGRVVAAVWAGPERCNIVLFHQTAGKFAPPPPLTGVGPGALADPAAFLAQLARAGIDTHVEAGELGFGFDTFALALEVLAGVTTAQLAPERRQEAKDAVQAAMWPLGKGSRHFRNLTQFLVGRVSV